jgi:hypothetical protein
MKKHNLNFSIGLDPAAPGFSITSNIRFYVPLNWQDAGFVDIIHTDRLAGMSVSTGTVDFYPNNFVQPGCPQFITPNDGNSLEIYEFIEIIKYSHPQFLVTMGELGNTG